MFGQQTDLMRHQQLHSEERQFSGNVCNKSSGEASADK